MKSKPRRHCETGGYPRGNETRAVIINTALRVFGERGFRQARTREIATKAGVNPPALQYYFHSKEGLHSACAQYLIDRASSRLLPCIDHAKKVSVRTDKAAALGALENLLDVLTEILSDPDIGNWSQFIMRGKHEDVGPGVEMICAQLTLPIVDTAADLLAIITGSPASSEGTRLRALLMLTPICWIYAGHSKARKIVRWPELDVCEGDAFNHIVREHNRSMLRQLLPNC